MPAQAVCTKPSTLRSKGASRRRSWASFRAVQSSTSASVVIPNARPRHSSEPHAAGEIAFRYSYLLEEVVPARRSVRSVRIDLNPSRKGVASARLHHRRRLRHEALGRCRRTYGQRSKSSKSSSRCSDDHMFKCSLQRPFCALSAGRHSGLRGAAGSGYGTCWPCQDRE